MKILICPNSFKGSCSALDIGTWIADKFNIRKPFSQLHSIHTQVLPVADGGDDTLDVLLHAFANEWESVKSLVTGPRDGITAEASWARNSIKKLVLIEAAQAHGLTILTNQNIPLEALAATSYGVGELISQALKTSLSELVVTLGGSASTDGGLGALQALGIIFLDKQHQPIQQPLCPRDFPLMQVIDKNSIIKLNTIFQDCKLTILTDVQNPLLGTSGTAYTFAKQKGASAQECQYLETELARLSLIIRQAFGVDNTEMIGSGAAGGLAYGLSHLPNSNIESGFYWLSRQIKLEEAIQASDCIITGEGRFDQTSLSGKATGEILALAKKYQKPVILLCGSRDETIDLAENIFPMGLNEAVEITVAIQEPKKALQMLFEQKQEALSDFLAHNTASLAQ